MNRKQDSLEVKIIRVGIPLFIYEGVLLLVQSLYGFLSMFWEFVEIGDSDTNMYQLAYHLFDNTVEFSKKYQLVSLFIAALITIWILLIIWKKEGISLKTAENAELGIRMGLLIVITGSFASTGISRFLYLLPLDHVIGSNEQVNEVFFSNPVLFQILTLCFATPIVEELVFRGMMYQRLCEYVDKWKAVVFTSVLFGIYHGNLVQGIYAAVLGFLACMVYEKSHTLLASILLHMAANTTALMTAYFPVSADITTNTLASVTVMLMELLGLAVCIYIILGLNGHVVHAGMKKHDFETGKNMRK